jgi:adenosylcobinamide-phosphate synthase
VRRALAFALGAAADASFGDPPTRWHPVGLVGNAAAALRPLAPTDEAARARFGLAVALGLPLAGALVAAAASHLAMRLLPWGDVVTNAVLLDAACSVRTLLVRALDVEAALASGDLDSARMLCGTHLVSRDTDNLDASEVAAATIESVAENLSDGVVAPWLAFALAGAPGAVAYRVANTMDALWGYHTPEFEVLGRAAARLDDVLNLLPARLTALVIVLAAATPTYGARCSARGAFATWRADRGRTDSPNAGHPMAAMAGALGVTLGKRGAYTLGAGQRPPSGADIGRAVRLARGAAMLTGVGLLAPLLVAETQCWRGR